MHEPVWRLLPLRFVTHSYRVARIAMQFGWLPGARYTNLRDVKKFDEIGFLDIDWKNYSFKRHLAAVRATRPLVTVAQDVENRGCVKRIIDQAWELAMYAKHVVIVPKIAISKHDLEQHIPESFIMGYSVPTRYGQTTLSPHMFRRPVHLLGGRPDVQRHLGEAMRVFSLDCNRFTLDAQFGDYFDGETFRPHPVGGYERCIVDSLRNINALWAGYDAEAKNEGERIPFSARAMRAEAR